MICENHLIVGTKTGELICCNENGEFIQVLKDSPTFILKAAWNVECLTTYNKGFIVGGDNAQIFVYKFTNDDHNLYELNNHLNIKANSDFKDI